MNHPQTPSELSFEEAMRKLEEILGQLANPNETLDNLIRLYEEGTLYMHTCKARLTEAEGKIKILNDKLAKEMPQEEN